MGGSNQGCLWEAGLTWNSCSPEGLGERARGGGGRGGGGGGVCTVVHTNPETDFPKIRTTSSPQEAHRTERKLKPVASYPNLPPCLPFVSSLA